MTSLEEAEKKLRNLEPVYRPKGDAAAIIGDVVLANIIGPCGAGKSTINKRVTELDPEFSVPLGFTTRAPRPNEQLKNYRHIPHTAQGFEEILKKAEAGELIQYTFHRKSGRVYGTEPQDYPTPYAVLDMLSSYVETTHELGFKEVVDIAIVSSLSDYEKQLAAQMKLINDPAAIEDRRLEGIQSLEWCLVNKDSVAWVRNHYGQPDEGALEVISIAKRGSRTNNDNWRLASKMLKYLQGNPFRSAG